MENNTSEYSENRELDDGKCLKEIFHTIESLLILRNSEDYSVKTSSQYFQIQGDKFSQAFIYEKQNIVAPMRMREVFTLSFVSIGLDKPFEERMLMGSLEVTSFDLDTDEVKLNTDLTYTSKRNKFLNEALGMLRKEEQKEIDIWNEKMS